MKHIPIRDNEIGRS